MAIHIYGGSAASLLEEEEHLEIMAIQIWRVGGFTTRGGEALYPHGLYAPVSHGCIQGEVNKALRLRFTQISLLLPALALNGVSFSGCWSSTACCRRMWSTWSGCDTCASAVRAAAWGGVYHGAGDGGVSGLGDGARWGARGSVQGVIRVLSQVSHQCCCVR